jgi:hypothetical protein
MFNKDQNQEASEGAIAIQAGGDVSITQTGLTYLEVREVALDVFRANFHKLAGKAEQVARSRAEEITEDFLHKLEKENPTGFEKAQDPDFQSALFTVQKEYAKSGDKDLGDLLVDLLIDRSKQEQRDILQIVLNESLNTAPKLTESHLAVLAIIFLFSYTQQRILFNHEKLGEYFDANVLPFQPKLVQNNACYQHLEFTGCGSVQMGSRLLEDALGITYQGLFLKGFDVSEIKNYGLNFGPDERFFIPCLNDPTKFQVRALSKESLEQGLQHQEISPEDKAKIMNLFEVGKMSSAEIWEKCVTLRPYMASVFEIWSNSSMKSFTLTSVGIAIGHANVKRLVGEFANLSLWIN